MHLRSEQRILQVSNKDTWPCTILQALKGFHNISLEMVAVLGDGYPCRWKCTFWQYGTSHDGSINIEDFPSPFWASLTSRCWCIVTFRWLHCYLSFAVGGKLQIGSILDTCYTCRWYSCTFGPARLFGVSHIPCNNVISKRMGLADKMKISYPHTIYSYRLLPVTGTHGFRASGLARLGSWLLKMASRAPSSTKPLMRPGLIGSGLSGRAAESLCTTQRTPSWALVKQSSCLHFYPVGSSLRIVGVSVQVRTCSTIDWHLTSHCNADVHCCHKWEL